MGNPSEGRARRWRKRAGVALAGALAAEGLAAWFWPAPPVDRRPLVRSEEAPSLGYRLVPGQRTYSYQAEVRTNAWGLRERSIEDLSSARVRVAFLGGSETFGKGVSAEQTFARRIETACPDLWSVNAGAPDYVLRQSLAWLEIEGPRILRPGDRVVLTLFWDDLRTDDSVPFPPDKARSGGDPTTEPSAASKKDSAPDEWFLRRWARQTNLLEYIAPLYTRSRVLYVARNQAKWAVGRLRGARWVRWQNGLRSDTWPDDLRAAYERGGRDLANFAELCRSRSYQPSVLLLPQVHEVENPTYPDRLRTGWKEQARAAELPVVDVTEPLRAAHRAGVRTHIPYDGAPSVQGHRVIAEAVLRSWPDPGD